MKKQLSVNRGVVVQALMVMCEVSELLAADRPWVARNQPQLEAVVKQARPLVVEALGIPVASVRCGELMLVPNPDGKTYDFLQWYFKGYSGPTTVFIGDLATGGVKKDSIPDRRQIHICGRIIGPDGKLYIATPDWQKGMVVYVYDPAANKLSCKGVVAPGLTGERREMCVGTDGMIYGSGSYDKERKAGAYQIDPKTGKVTDYGPLGPSHAPNGCWCFSVAADDRYVYVASGMVPWFLVAHDRQTGRDETLVTTETSGGMVSVSQGRHGCTASARKVVGTDGKPIEYWLYKGKALPKKDPKEKPPWPELPDSKPWIALPPRPEFFVDSASPAPDGKAVLWYRTPEARLAAPKTQLADPTPEVLGWKAIPLQVPTYPMTINRLTELPDGRILGSADSYEGNFIFDPASGKSMHLGKNSLSHYATAIRDGKVYMSGYPASITYVLDPTKPWTIRAGNPARKPIPETHEQSNPRKLGDLVKWAGTSKMYAAAVGVDGRVYFGGRWWRDGNGGGFGWWDTRKGEGGGFWREFSNYQITQMTAADGGRLIVISTMRVRDVTLGKPEPKQGKLFVWDAAQAKLVREIEPVEGAKGTGFVVGVGGARVLGWTEDPTDLKSSTLYGVDAASGVVAFRRKLPFPLPVGIGSNQMEPHDFRLGPDGKVWTFLGGALVRIDPSDTAIEVLGKLPLAGRLAFSGGDVYLSGSEHLRRIRGLTTKK